MYRGYSFLRLAAMYGVTAGKAAINRIPLCTNQACCNLEIDPSKALPKYVLHYLACRQMDLKALGSGPRGNLNASKIKSYSILLPPLEEQQRIVGMIDTFQNYIANLDRQATLRQRQYEYFRDLLMSF